MQLGWRADCDGVQIRKTVEHGFEIRKIYDAVNSGIANCTGDEFECRIGTQRRDVLISCDFVDTNDPNAYPLHAFPHLASVKYIV
jgi:hypothetical protein